MKLARITGSETCACKWQQGDGMKSLGCKLIYAKLITAGVLCWLLLLNTAWPIDPIEVEFLWQSQPKLNFDWRLAPIQINVDITPAQLNSDVVRERMQAVQHILRAPKSPQLKRAVVLKALLERLNAGEAHPVVRTEMIAAACELDDGKNAEQLWKLAKGNREAELAVERACIEWHLAFPIEQWRRTLARPAANELDLLIAIDGIGSAGSNSDVELLEKLVLDGARTSSVRLQSARAIGKIAQSNQMPLAKKLRASSALNPELLATEVLFRTEVPAATEFVQDIALHGAPLAQRRAYQWLCERDAMTAQRLVNDFLNHADSEVRLLALHQILLADNDQTLPALFKGISDVNPKVRLAAREKILVCCNRGEDRLKTSSELLAKAMESNDWQTLEQAIRLAVELKQNSYDARLLSLIENTRPEISVTACWALRHLAESDATLAGMLEYVKKITEMLANSSEEIREIHLRRAAHLMEGFGKSKYEPAKETLLRYVPKNSSMGLITRMTAIWSCGKLWENSDNQELVEALHGRIADTTSMFPEPMSLRFAATLALGWIADPSSREPLIRCDERKPYAIGFATEWALQRIEERERKK